MDCCQDSPELNISPSDDYMLAELDTYQTSELHKETSAEQGNNNIRPEQSDNYISKIPVNIIEEGQKETSGNSLESENHKDDSHCSEELNDTDKKNFLIVTDNEPKIKKSIKEEEIFTADTSKHQFDEVILTSAHSISQHIRHNTNNQSNTCPVCNKTLSSASSLDRHMLVHTGERPYKCKLCPQSFTTNGNMHRHMRIHGDFSEETKMKNSKRKTSLRVQSSPPLKRRTLQENTIENQSKITCLVCGNSFLSEHDLTVHMELHPNDPIQCPDCEIISKDYDHHTKHQCLGKEKIKNESEESLSFRQGFQDLALFDFTSNNFSVFAKSFCERQIRRPSSVFHNFECKICHKAFPSGKVLSLHEMSHKIGTYCSSCCCDLQTSTRLRAHQLKHRPCAEYYRSNPGLFQKKKDFLVFLDLMTTDMKDKMNGKKNHATLENFESMSYFVFGKPTNGEDSVNLKNKTSMEINKQNANNDFADIQSIISLTSKAPSLMSCSSPVMVSPSSPSQVTSCLFSVSPLVADSAQASPETPRDDCDHSIEKDFVISDDANYNEESNESWQTQISENYKSKVHQNKSFSCSKCSYTTFDNGTLRRHLQIHKERPFQCIICNDTFTTKANCERHIRNRHDLETKEEINCATRYNLNITDAKNSDFKSAVTYCCKFCKTSFPSEKILRHHLRSTNNSCPSKPYLCKNCNMGFSTKNNCIRHIVNQHPHLKENPNEAVYAVASSNDNLDYYSLSINHTAHTSALNNNNFNYISLSPNHNTLITASHSNNFDYDLSENYSKHYDGQPLNLSSHANFTPSDNEISNDSCRNEAAESLMSLYTKCFSIPIYSTPPQEEALDLSVHPLDYSGKINENKSITAIDKLPLLIDSKKINSLPTCISPSEFACSLSFMGESKSSEKSWHDSSPVSLIQNSHSKKCHKCNYCSVGFTYKSNMDRHVKKKHPEYARPVRSRNYIPNKLCKVEKQNSTALSQETRNALRSVLNNKVLSVPIDQIGRDIHSEENLKINDSEQNETQSSIIDGKKDCENVIDLASISDVIDTANSQQFKQYLRDIRSDDKVETKNNDDKDDCNVVNQLNLENKTTGRKRSSYAASPNSIACKYCGRKFPWSSSLRRHELTHTKQKPFKCPKCPVKFSTKSNCQRHFGRKHSGEFCKRSVPERPFKCHLCTSSAFATQGNLVKHFYMKHLTKNNSIRNRIKSQKNVTEYRQFQKENEDPSINVDMNISENDNYDLQPDDSIFGKANNSEIMYCCHICCHMIKTREEYFAHLGNHNDLNSIPDNVNEQLSKSSIQIENNSGSAQSKIACAFCSLTFFIKKEFLHHIKNHLNNKKRDISCGLSNHQKAIDNFRTSFHTRNCSPNSLLHLMQSNNFNSDANTTTKSQTVPGNEDNTDLIQNLLGVDAKIIDKVLDSSIDSAAKLLGVRECN